MAASAVAPSVALAQETHAAVPRPALMNLAREFVSRMKQNLPQAAKNAPPTDPLSGLPDGEQLMISTLFMPERLKTEDMMMGRVQNREVALALRDFATVLELPITVDAEAGTAKGWYIQETHPFTLDMATRRVQTDRGAFTLSDNVTVMDGDIYVPVSELKAWTGIEVDMDLSLQQIRVTSEDPLPRVARHRRENRKSGRYDVGPPVLPRLEGDEPGAIGVPVADVSTASFYSKSGAAGQTFSNHVANIATAGDFAQGTLRTQTQLQNEEGLSNFRINYRQESPDDDLLGPLRARRFEIGDVLTTNMQLADGLAQELGARVTNADPLRVYTRPTTAITGYAQPGWDIELYRDNQLLDTVRVGDDGFYQFDDVVLYRDNNTFRVVQYGPQGERREENVYLPVDPRRLTEQGGVYDVSLTLKDSQTYTNVETADDQDKNTPNLRAFYEVGVGDESAVYAGFRSTQENGDAKAYVHGGGSTVLMDALVNLDLAADEAGEAAAELVMRRDIGRHEVRSSLRAATDEYGDNVSNGIAHNNEVLGSRFDMNGPLPFLPLGRDPRYTLSTQNSLFADGQKSFMGLAGVNTSWDRFNLNQSFSYTDSDMEADARIDSLTALSGGFGSSRIRLNTDYEVKPDSRLARVAATFQHYFSNEIDTELSVEKRQDPAIMEGTARVNWNAPFARISPSVTYNDQGDVRAMLNTNFGIGYAPQGGGVKMSNRSLTAGGLLSVFVFLDRDGDGAFNGEDEVIPDVIVRALQNGGRETTDENGVAHFKQMRNMQPTDIVVDQGTLKDPFWIPSYKGASILPRDGHTAVMQFPINIGGEIDGVLYVDDGQGGRQPLRGVKLGLYDMEGTVVKEAVSAPDGFYLLDLIPPGYYMLMINDADAKQYKLERPLPQQVVIGYDGTIIYGNDITVKSGSADVPVGFAAGITDYLAANPGLDPSMLAGRSVILNLGSYKSQLLMGLMWYELRHRYAGLLGGGQLLVLPSQSYAAPETGLHELLVEMPGLALEEGVRRCRALAARGMTCGVELIPVQGLPARTASR